MYGIFQIPYYKLQAFYIGIFSNRLLKYCIDKLYISKGID